MADVNLQLVREFFELHVFRVLTNWRQEPLRGRAAEFRPQLFVENAHPGPKIELPFLLDPVDLCGIACAVVHVRAWHADRFYPSTIESSPVLSQFERDEASAMAEYVFGGQPYATLLVISELPVSRDLRGRSLRLFRDAGVDHVLEFAALLRGLLEQVSENGNYTGSATLQTLRLLKRYKLVRAQQLEFSFPTEPPLQAATPRLADAKADPDPAPVDDEEAANEDDASN